MQFNPPLQQATLQRRYKRFLADIELPGGEIITLHCPNTGSMKNCQEPGSRIWYSRSNNPKRKYPHTWQIIEVDSVWLVGINTGLANTLVREAIESGVVEQLQGYPILRTEVPYGEQNSRIDIVLENTESGAVERCYVEVKNVSLGLADGIGSFPDAVTTRGQKHLQELMHMRSQGHRAVLFFCVQHNGIESVRPADDIDPEYGRLLRQAADQGVEVLAYGATLDVRESRIEIVRHLPVDL
jgi:sugar fermentation stimulation protein A